MGPFEKIVVLVAFFLVTVILVVTFNAPPEEGLELSMGDETAQPIDAGSVAGEEAPTGAVLARDQPAPGANPRRVPSDRGPLSTSPAPSQEERGDAAPSNLGGRGLEEMSRRESEELAGDLLLDDSFQARPTQPTPLPEGAALVTLEGLSSTFDSTIMEYTWRRGDAWDAVAERLYGDPAKADLLRQFNEGADYHAPGERILVPIFDGREGRAGVAMERAVNDAPAAKRETLSEERGNLYRVVDGDSLWVISKKVYGRGALWEKIYEANQDQLSSRTTSSRV